MDEKPYSVVDAIQDEVELLEELQKLHESKDLKLLAVMYREQKFSLKRIANRYSNGKEYFLTVKNGKTVLDKRQTTRHLERDYPSVAKSKQNLDTVVAVTKGSN